MRFGYVVHTHYNIFNFLHFLVIDAATFDVATVLLFSAPIVRSLSPTFMGNKGKKFKAAIGKLETHQGNWKEPHSHCYY